MFEGQMKDLHETVFFEPITQFLEIHIRNNETQTLEYIYIIIFI